MGLQFIDIKDSNVKFANKASDPLRPLETDMAAMVFESMQDKIKIAQLENDLGIALMEILNIKIGGSQ